VKNAIRQLGHELGADVVGFAAIDDYHSPKSPNPATVLPGVQSMVIMGYREVNGALESENARIGMAARMGIINLSLKNNYQMARHIEDEFQAKAVGIPFSYPLDMGPEIMGLVGDVSLRHAAVAAGLGVFGRRNLVIHPRLGTRIVFSAILTDLAIDSDLPIGEEFCDDCGICVEACPANALDEEGKTHVFRFLKESQPYGMRALYRYLRRYVGAPPEQQRALLKEPLLIQIHQAQFIGFQYTCNACMSVCPVRIDSEHGKAAARVSVRPKPV
jgi:epoxyqueuosine reductase